MSSDSQIVRQWLTIRRLADVPSPGLTIQQLADEAAVSIKTTRRDIDQLKDVGFPVVESEGEYGRKYWRMDFGWKLGELSFTFDEAFALYMSRQYLNLFTGTMF